MKNVLLILLICLFLPSVTVNIVHATTLGPKLEVALASAATDEDLSVIITMSDKVDMRSFFAKKKSKSRSKLKRAKRAERRKKLVAALKGKAKQSQVTVASFLKKKRSKRIRSLWIVNGLSVKATPEVIYALANRPGIESIRLDGTLAAPIVSLANVTTVEWNLDAVRALEFWNLGHAGAGAVIASMDTGVDVMHPDLSSNWRGGSNSWFDPYGEHATPYDVDGHGTHTMGIMVGGDAGGTSIGVAPDAEWIAVKIFNDAGLASYSAIHEGFQWLLDPDQNPETDDAPDVVNNSWGLPTSVNQCITEFEADIQVLKAADIGMVFSAGNEGSNPQSSVSPANYSDSFAVGAVDREQFIDSLSSRGPSPCDNSIFPEIVAPGVSVRTADLTFGGMFPYSYITTSGTSFSAPHVSAGMALLVSAYPDLAIGEIEQALKDSALDLGPFEPDNDYGYGMLDLVGAYELLQEQNSEPEGDLIAADDSYSVDEDGWLGVEAPGVLDNDTPVTTVGLASPLTSTTHGALVLNDDGSFIYEPESGFHGSDWFTYQVTDGIRDSNLATVFITVEHINRGPVAKDDATTIKHRRRTTINLVGNDTDAEGDIDPKSIVIISKPTHGGGVTPKDDGTVIYRSKRGFIGTESFSYQVSDFEGAASNTATVRVNVVRRYVYSVPENNTPPIATDDSITVKQGRRIGINVLGNDMDAEGNIDPRSVIITSKPTQGGKIARRTNGRVVYRAKRGFVGIDTFTYTIKDLARAVSNTAVVHVNVVRRLPSK